MKKIVGTFVVFLVSILSFGKYLLPLFSGLRDVNHGAHEQLLCSTILPTHEVEHTTSLTSQMIAFSWFLEF